MNLLFDTSVWVEHLRRGALDGVIPLIRGKFILWFDSIAGAELVAGCRSKRERGVVKSLLKPSNSAGRVVTPTARDYERAATALSRLQEHREVPRESRRRTVGWSDSGPS